MTHFELTSAILSVIGILLIPLMSIMIRGAVKWTRTEGSLNDLVTATREKNRRDDKVHEEMYAQMRIDREATNTRLRYLEEYFMSHGMRR